MILKAILTFLSLFFGTVFIQAESSKMYSYDYATNITCKEQGQGQIKICRGVQPTYGLQVLDIYYTPSSNDSSEVKVWIKVKYDSGARIGLFPMSLQTDFSSGKNIYFIRMTGGCLVGEPVGCAQRGSQEFLYLFEFAQMWGGGLNALEIELAFFDNENHWVKNGKPNVSYPFYFKKN